MNKKYYYPLAIFGLIGVYHIGIHFMGSDYEAAREAERKKAEEERLARIKSI